MDKKLSQTLHAKKRAAERYGINLDKTTRRAIKEQISQGKSKFIEKQSNRISVHEVEIKGQQIKVVYDKNRKNIVTILPSGWLRKMIRHLSVFDIIGINHKLIDLYGGMGQDYGPPIGIDYMKDITLLESAIMQPRFDYGYDSVPEKVGLYIFHIVKNHPFLDGNKRTGFASGAIFALMNQHNFISQESLAETIVGVAASTISKEEFMVFCTKNVQSYACELQLKDAMNFVLDNYNETLQALANK